MTASAPPGTWALTSAASVPVAPVSAMASIPELAVAPNAQNCGPELWTAPMSDEKCAPEGNMFGWVEALHVAENTTR